MTKLTSLSGRRSFLGVLACGGSAYLVPGAFAQEVERMRTPSQTEGPFYPDKLPLDTDNDLLIINDAITPAVGEITHLTGRILDAKGSPIRNALVEIWQVDNNGVYIHSKAPDRGKHDDNFQGFGRFLTGRNGDYYFRTIKPVPYTDGNVRRTPHIHFKVKKGGKELLTTQIYVTGEPKNEKDFILNGIRDAQSRKSVIVDFAPISGSRIGELAANFDAVLGVTPDETPGERRGK
jgi:protocatechuate 3,4-dioxygenase beta subunit